MFGKVNNDFDWGLEGYRSWGLWAGMVQDDAVRDDAIATGISSSVGDSGNVEQFGRKGMGFCRRQLKSKVGVLTWGILQREL